MIRPPQITSRFFVLMAGNYSGLAKRSNFTSLWGKEWVGNATGTGYV